MNSGTNLRNKASRPVLSPDLIQISNPQSPPRFQRHTKETRFLAPQKILHNRPRRGFTPRILMAMGGFLASTHILRARIAFTQASTWEDCFQKRGGAWFWLRGLESVLLQCHLYKPQTLH